MLHRFAQLYCLHEHSLPTCCAILNEEFQDIEVNPITQRDLELLIEKNRDWLKEVKEEMTAIIKEEQTSFIKEIANIAFKSESRLAKQLAKKLDDLVTVMIDCDLTIVDEDTGKPINMSAYLGLLEACEKTQKLIGKLAGTDVMREVETYKIKAQIDAEIKANSSNNLIPTSGKEIKRPTVMG